jgi:hypothetical protein
MFDVNEVKGEIYMKKLKLKLMIFLLLIFSVTCNKNKNPLDSSINHIRAGIKLSKSDIPALNETTELKSGERPWLWDTGVVKFIYSWELTQNDFLNVDLIVAETKELAHNYLIERRRQSSIPLDLLEPKDQPTVVGDISYGSGREFIRDNIIIEIHAEGEFKEKITEIAKQIDALLLKSPLAISADQMRPVINNFEITQNPVKHQSITRLIIDVKDPMNGKLYYDWRFTPGSENWGGIEIDDSGNYYYYAETNESIEELSLFVINDCGFFSFATIYIHVEI